MSRPLLPAAPACWSWDLPPLPQPNELFVVRRWQDGRCAICGKRPRRSRGLVEDHDHVSGDTRGFLCDECNLQEGEVSAPPVFAAYRSRFPTLLLGILNRYGRNQHPLVAAAQAGLHEALGVARLLSDDMAWAEHMQWTRDTERPAWTPLARAVHRVGLSGRELTASKERRDAIALADKLHLPTESDPARRACDEDRRWSAPPRVGWMRRPCPECWAIDPARMQRMVGDGWGHHPDEDGEALQAEANRWRTSPTPFARKQGRGGR